MSNVVVIAGGRDVPVDCMPPNLPGLVREIFGEHIDTIVQGGALGVDRYAKQTFDGLDGWSVVQVSAEWRKYGKRAGPLRNKKMAEMAEGGVLLVWNGASPGSANMKREALALNRKVHEVIVKY